MAIIQHKLDNGRVRTYSNAGYKIERDGVRYDSAVDPDLKGRVYTETDERIGGASMKYSTLSIKRELAKIGAWDEAKALLEASGYWDDYVLANYLSEQDEAFKAASAALVAKGIVTETQLTNLLPKCVWSAD